MGSYFSNVPCLQWSGGAMRLKVIDWSDDAYKRMKKATGEGEL